MTEVAGIARTLRIPGVLRHLHHGRLGPAFAALYRAEGPQFLFRAPFLDAPILVLMGVEANEWAAQQGHRQLRPLSRLAADCEQRELLREALAPVRASEGLASNLSYMQAVSYTFMADWQVGDVLRVSEFCQDLAERQMCELRLGATHLGCMNEYIAIERREVLTRGLGLLWKAMRRTQRMASKRRRIDGALRNRMLSEQDDAPEWIKALLQAHANHPQKLPLIDLPPHLEEVLFASKRLGDLLALCLSTLASHPDLHEQVKREADAVFSGDLPEADAFASEQVDTARRVYLETLRLFPPVPFVLREVMNPLSAAGRDLPLGSRVLIAQVTPHYLEEVFTDPASFDIDRFGPDRNEHLRPGAFAPFGLGSHACPASDQSELYVLANLLSIVHCFNFQVTPSCYALRLQRLPTNAPGRQPRMIITRKRNPLPT